MPALRGPQLINAVLRALEEAGASAMPVSTMSGHPRRLMVQAGQSVFEVWIYIWTVTYGGYPRSRNEYRIQMTGVTSPLRLNTSGYTVLLGYEPNLNVFAGFDLEKHIAFATGSPSIQIPLGTLKAAVRDGLAFATKGNDEIAIAIRPDQLLSYTMNAQMLHQQATDAVAVALLSKIVSAQPIEPLEIEQLPADQRRVLSQVSRLTREANFRRKVMVAYDRRCAVTRIQLKLVDAAHILPVGAEGSNDEVNNGLCLSPTFHRAFDRGLMYLDDDLHMRINTKQERELARLHQDGGLSDFKRYLGTRIHLPANRRQWPDRGLIRAANRFRNIAD